MRLTRASAGRAADASRREPAEEHRGAPRVVAPLFVARLLLLLYPRAFRGRWGDEIAGAFEERWHDTEAGRPGFRRARASFDLARAALLERMSPSSGPRLLRGRRGARRSLPRGNEMELPLQDLRHAVRTLLRRPGYSLVAVLTLALGIGACVAIWSVVHAVLIRQLPYPDADRLVTVVRLEPHRDLETTSLSQPDLRDLAAAPALDALAWYSQTSFVFTGGERPEVVVGAATSGGFLGAFGIAPHLGRDIVREEAVPDGPSVTLLSFALWQERFGGDRNIVGRPIELDGKAFEVVGVAPPGFEFPEGSRLWVPLDIDEEGCGRGCNLLRAVGRLGAGVPLASAQSEIDTIAARLRDTYPEEVFGTYFRLEGLRDRLVGPVRRGLLVLLGAVGCVLLVAIANVANLWLAHGTARREELALRAALGAGRARVARLLALENALVVIAAGILGTAAAAVGLRALLALAPEDLPRLDDVRLDGPVLLFALGLVALTTLVFALGPAWRLAGRSRALALRSRGGEGAPAYLRSVLLAAEVALSLVLLLAAGLLLRSFQRMLEIELGFSPERVTTFFVALPENRYDEPGKIAAFFEALEPRLRAIPGVEATGAILGAPLDRSSISSSIDLLDRPSPPEGQEETAAIRIATPGYFAAAGVPLLEGRLLQDSDRHGTQGVVVVNRAFAERYFPGRSPLGAQMSLSVDFDWPQEASTIVGVVGDVRSGGLTEDPPVEVYVAQSQMAAPWLTVLVRAAPGVDVIGPSEAIVAELDPDVPLRRPETMTLWVERARGPALFFLTLIGIFAALALVLAAVGLYGVVAYLVSRRTREIAIRMAVGADRRSVLGLVLRQGMMPVLAGIAAGLAGSVLVGRALRALLFEVAANDAATVSTVTLVLAGVAALAMLLPARRASRIAPARALGTD